MNKMEKLPLIMLEKRPKDQLDTEGGGSGKNPTWMLNPSIPEQRLELEIKSSFLQKQLSIVNQKFSLFMSKNELPIIASLTINEKAIAKTYRSKIKGFCGISENESFLTVIDKELIFKISSQSQINHMLSLIEDIDLNSYGINCIDEIRYNQPRIKNKINAKYYKIRLVNFNKENTTLTVEESFIKSLNDKGIQTQKMDFIRENTIIKCDESIFLHLNDINGFENYIISIEPLPQVEVSCDFIDDNVKLDIKLPITGKKYPIIGLLDSGIAKNEYLSPWIIGEYSCYANTDIDRNHGTFVAGIINYGNELFDNTFTNPCFLYDAVVIPNTKILSCYEDELLSNIDEAIASNPSIKIWNMSLGTNTEIDISEFSDFAIGLDKIQDKYGVIIIKSAGNHSNKIPLRISKPADTVRGLTVGSISHKDGLVLKNNLSPFSRVGRGPASIIKPELVSYGGSIDRYNKPIGVKSISPNGSIVSNIGTSFSTPRISNLVANLAFETNQEFDSLFLKALIIHNSSYRFKTEDNLYKVNSFGFGTPKEIDEMLYSRQNEATIIIRDKIIKGHFIDIFDFPVPDCFNSTNTSGQITVTLVTKQILDPTQGSEYCQSDIDVKFGVFDSVINRDIDKSNLLKNPYGRKEPLNILLESKYSKKKLQKNLTDFSYFERYLIDNNSKFYPIKKYSVDLVELKQSIKSILSINKKWFLQIRGIIRNETENKSKIDGEIIEQDFCIMITLKDPSGTFNVYDDTIRKINSENFIYSTVQTNNYIVIKT